MRTVMLTLITFVFCLFSSVTQASATCSANEKASLKNTILPYADKNTAVGSKNIEIQSEKCAEGYASAMLHPTKPVADDAKIYLHNVNGKWEVLNMGTDFDESFLNQLPAAVR